MLISSMSVSLDGFVNDRDGGIDWGAPSEEQHQFSLAQVGELGGYLLGRRLYETMLPFETDPSMRRSEFGNAFADVWSALPKVVFSHTLDAVEGNARLATAPLGEEIASALAATDQDVSIGGADLLGQALEHGLLGEVRMFRGPVVLGGGTPYLPTVSRALHLELVETRRFDQVVYERYRLGGEIGATPAGSDT